VDVYKKGMFMICTEICPIAIPAFLHQIQIQEFSQFGLNCTDGKTDAPLNFTHVQFFSAEAEQHPKDFSPNPGTEYFG
jgi:hypothetical protein